MARLKVIFTRKLAKVYDLNKPVITIGRAPENDIQILAKSVSRKHAQIIFEQQRPIIRDLGSANGTKVNGVQISEAVLNDGDLISIGGVRIIFFMKEEPIVAPEFTHTIKSLPLPEGFREKVIAGEQLGLIFPTSREIIETCYDVLCQFIGKCSIAPEDTINLQTALYEAIDNARRHGNRDDPRKMIRVFLRDWDDRITATVIDEGEGFDFVSVLRKTASQNAVDAARQRYMQGGVGGLGVRLMLRCVDRLEYDNKGTKITLTKIKTKVPAQKPPAPAPQPAKSVDEHRPPEAVATHKGEVDKAVDRAGKSKITDVVERYKDHISRILFGEEEVSEKERSDMLHFNIPDEFGFEEDGAGMGESDQRQGR
ncbi:MAG: hypothetical protein DRP63_02745 [Planctomycetota bacterium]|nr:MAG: hypothetical protein DRP63_02745 [Planctomycetota bacterium]